MQNQSGSENHRLRQKARWKDFCKYLESLKSKESGLSITNSELAKGLLVSRQLLHEFINEPERGLPIDRANILELWDYLTDPELVETKKIPLDARKKREKLRREESSALDTLLRSAGFLPTSQTVDEIPPQIERVKRRLAGFWIPDSSVLSKITDNIIDTILDQGGLAKSEDEKFEKGGYSAEEAITWPKKNIPSYERDKDTSEKFAREIIRFENLGKVKFSDSELFELYQSISENFLLKNFDINVRVTDCQFKTLTFSLVDKFEKLDAKEEFKEKLSTVCIVCEKSLRSSKHIQNDPSQLINEFLRYPPVIEASVTLNFLTSEELVKDNSLVFKYASSATHLENMLAALSNGLGYLLSLKSFEITSLSIRAISKSLDSLSRIIITLTDKSKSNNYQGLWVEGNMILGILQAFLFASLNWISETIDSENISAFFNFSRQMSNLHEDLNKRINQVYNHVDMTDKDIEKDLQEINDRVPVLIKEIENLSKKTRFKNQETQERINEYYMKYRENLARKRFLTRLALIHFNIDRSSSKQVNSYLQELNSNLRMGDFQITSNENFTPIIVLYNSEQMFYKLISGDSDFIKDKEWRNPAIDFALEDALQKLRKYIIEKNSGIIDVDIYLSLAQLFGITGLVEFYVCQKEDTKHLEKAVDSFLSAAYYSARIGHYQRVVRVLCYASRTYCRLGYQEESEQIIKAAEAVDPSQTSMSQLELAKGERLLRFGKSPNELYQALRYFLCAWYSSIEQNEKQEKILFRRNIDSLYNIFRVFESLENSEANKALMTITEFFEREKYELKDALKKFQEKYSLDGNSTFRFIKEKIKKEVIGGWNSCCIEEGKEHPFSNCIKEGNFLEYCTEERS